MSFEASRILTPAARVLHDTGNVRWTEAELLKWLTEGTQALSAARPEAFGQTLCRQLVAGAAQTLPDNVSALFGVPYNVPLCGGGAPPGSDREELLTLTPNTPWDDPGFDHLFDEDGNALLPMPGSGESTVQWQSKTRNDTTGDPLFHYYEPSDYYLILDDSYYPSQWGGGAKYLDTIYEAIDQAMAFVTHAYARDTTAEDQSDTKAFYQRIIGTRIQTIKPEHSGLLNCTADNRQYEVGTDYRRVDAVNYPYPDPLPVPTASFDWQIKLDDFPKSYFELYPGCVNVRHTVQLGVFVCPGDGECY